MAEGNALIAALRANTPMSGSAPSGPVALTFPWQTNAPTMSTAPRTPTARPSSKSTPPVDPTQPTQPNKPAAPPPEPGSLNPDNPDFYWEPNFRGGGYISIPKTQAAYDELAGYLKTAPAYRWTPTATTGGNPSRPTAATVAPPVSPSLQSNPSPDRSDARPSWADPLLPVNRTGPANAALTGVATAVPTPAPATDAPAPVVQPPPSNPMNDPGMNDFNWDSWLDTDVAQPAAPNSAQPAPQPSTPEPNPYAFNWDDVSYMGLDPSVFMVPGATIPQQPAPEPVAPDVPQYQPDIPWWYFDQAMIP